MNKKWLKDMLKLTAISFCLMLCFTLSVPPAEAKTSKAKVTAIALKKGKQYKIKNGSKAYGWRTSDKKIATVTSKGVIKAKKSGVVTIKGYRGKKVLKYRVAVNGVKLSAANFPYAKFRKVITKYDKDKDGLFSKKEIDSVTYFQWRFYKKTDAKDLKGLNIFTNITELYLYDAEVDTKYFNKLGKLKVLSLQNEDTEENLNIINANLTYFPKLTYLSVNDSGEMAKAEFHSLDVSKCPNLKYFSCYNTSIDKLDLSKNIKLTTLSLSNNMNLSADSIIYPETVKSLQILSLLGVSIENSNLGKMTELRSLTCNMVKEIDVTPLSKLEALSICDSQIEKLNLVNLTRLTYLSCSRNSALSELTFKNTPALETINCDRNQLTELDLRGLFRLRTIDCTVNKLVSLNLVDNTSLEELQCWQNSLTQINVYSRAIQYVYCDEECTVIGAKKWQG